MSPARLLVLAVIALGLVAIAIWTVGREAPRAEGPGEGRLWPELAAGIGAVERVGLVSADGTQVGLYRDGSGWRVEERDGWFADSVRVEALLRDLARARKLEAKTAREVHYPLLGVEPIDSAGATGVAIDIELEGRARRLLVGKVNLHSVGQFVRFADDAQSWLVDLDLGIPADARRWLDRDLVDIAALRVDRLTITPMEGEAIGILRTPGEGSGHALVDGGPGVDAGKVEAAATLFEGLRLDDVAVDRTMPGEPVPDVMLPEPIDVHLETVDGLELHLHSWRAGPQRWLRFTVGFDIRKARRWAETEVERDRMALEAATQPVIDGGEAASAPLDPVRAGMAPVDVDLRLQQLQDRAAHLEQRLQGWAFSLPPRKQAIIEATRDDYLGSLD